MVPDLNLINRIMVDIEKSPISDMPPHINYEDVSDKVVNWHLAYLINDKKLLKGKILGSVMSPADVAVLGITEIGYDFIKSIKDIKVKDSSTSNHQYDIALSFAGEDRTYAEMINNELKKIGVNVFYDNDEAQKALLWGKNLYEYLSDLYQNKAKYCLMFLSKNYAQKRWPNHERQAAQTRAFNENTEYILPIRLDDTVIPGVLATVGYLEWNKETPESIARIILIKLNVKK